MVVFVDQYSVLQILCHLDLLFRAEKIIIYGRQRYFSRICDFFGISKRCGKWLTSVTGLNKKVVFADRYDSLLFSSLYCKANKDSMDRALLASKEFAVESSFVFLKRLFNLPDETIKFYQSKYALYISHFSTMIGFIKGIARDTKTVAIVGYEEFTKMPPQDYGIASIDHLRPVRSKIVAFIGHSVNSLYWKTEWILSPLAYLFRIIARLSFRIPKPKHYKLWMQMHWGIPSDEMNCFIKRPYHDYYLYSDAVKSGEILHLYEGSWKFEGNHKDKTNQYMDQHGYTWADNKDLRLNIKWLWKITVIQGKLLVNAACNLFYLGSISGLLHLAKEVLVLILKKEVELEHYRARVYFDRTDYNPRHIIDSIVLNRHGTKTVGLFHHATPHHSPQIAFCHFDHYIVFSELVRRQYEKYWRGLDIVRIGRMNLDWVARLKNNPKTKEKIKERFEKEYGNFDSVITIVLPGDIFYFAESRWLEIEKGLRKFVSSDVNAGVIVRFKTEAKVKASRNLKRLWELCQSDSRLIVNQRDYTTYESLGISDMIVAPNVSFSVFESITMDVPLFIFDLDGVAYDIFREYGKDFLITTGDELFERLRAGRDALRRYDCDWSRLKDDANYTYEGNNIEIMREFVASLAS